LTNKLSLLSVFMCVMAASVVGFSSSFVIASRGKPLFVESIKNNSVATSHNKADQLLEYLEFIQNQITNLASSSLTQDAMIDFSQAFQHQQPTTTMRQSLRNYYTQSFATQYQSLTGDPAPAEVSNLKSLSDTAVYWQYQYISNNPAPLGEKLQFNTANDGSFYSQSHSHYHPQFKNILETFGYYDIFFVDIETSHVVYTVFKELDFATSLRDGPFKNSGLARAFRGAAALNQPKSIYFEDFDPYTPSYESMAAFISTPIFKNNKKVGVLIFQMPIDNINTLLTYNSKWDDAGLGQHGETYLISQSKHILNEPRTFLEQPEAFVSYLSNSGTSSQIIDSIKAKHSAIGLHTINSPAVQSALEGNHGFINEINHMGKDSYISYEPLNFAGARWALFTDMNKEEMLQGYESMSSQTHDLNTLIILITTITAGLITFFLVRHLLNPLKQATDAMLAMAEGDGDLTKRLPCTGNDELSHMAANFNKFVEKVQQMVATFVDSVGDIKTGISRLKTINDRSVALIHKQDDQSAMISSAITQMVTSIQCVASNAETVASASEKSNTDIASATQIFQRTLDEIDQNSTKIQEAESVINQLESETKSIGSVLDVIRGIAEQTNLLALNAAIEAARAGEQGRGFAVVADEVRTLASRTQASTQEIEDMISRLQSGASNAVRVMADSRDSALSSIEKGKNANEAVTNTAESISRISHMMTQVATATEEQSTVSENINQNIVGISELTSQVSTEFQHISNASNELHTLAQTLEQKTQAFKL
ncbi:MAG: methyl-accepting chemotaxis protein, partial [Gammaproteobacteria bacterium]